MTWEPSLIVPITVFLGMLFPMISFWVALIIIGFLVRLVGYPIKLFVRSIFNLV